MDQRPSLTAALAQTWHKYRKWEPLIFFVCGFAFDAALLHDINDPLMLVHQAIYLCCAATVIGWDMLVEAGVRPSPQRFARLWSYREGFLHFILGTLLNVYTIFYFKSGTVLSSLVFLVLLAILLYLNEVRPKRVSKHILRNTLFGLCLFSYVNILVSILIGSIGILVFLLALAVTVTLLALFAAFLNARLESNRVTREIVIPFVAVAAVYTTLYFMHVLPPVPLSIKHIGIYHDVQKGDDSYRLGYMKPAWRFWESGDQTFSAAPGDKIYCFVQVFSPSRFHEQLFVRWSFYDSAHGWVKYDAIPLATVGGRAEGYRGFTSKSNYQPGDWRVTVETSDGREVGRIGLTVRAEPDLSVTRTLTYESH